MTTATLTRSDTVLCTALQYAERGWWPFFLGDRKRPVANCKPCDVAGPDHDREACTCLTCHAFYAATTDPDRIRAMRAAIPRGMLAIRTGARSGLVVVDIDPGNGGDAQALIDRRLTPPTAYVRTGSGGGHMYYRHPGVTVPNSSGLLGPGIDVRGDGGYVVAPPSIHPRTRQPYVWVRRGPLQEMPAALVDACRPAAPPPAPTGPVNTRAGEGIARPDRLLAAHLAAVERATPGTRRTTLYGAARGVARMVAAGAIRRGDAIAVLTDTGRRAEQTERDIRRAIEGGFRAEGVHL